MRFASFCVALGTLLCIAIPAQADNTGVPVGSSRLIVDLDYSDTFTGTEAGGMAGRDWGVYPVPVEGLAVEYCYDNPQVQWTESAWSINADDNALPGATPWPGGSEAGSETGMTQTGGGGNDWSIPYGLRNDFVVQMDAVQGNDRLDIWISASDSFFDPQALAVFFRGSDYAGGWGKIGIFHNAEYDSGLTSTAPIGQWHNFAVHFMLDAKKLEIFTDEVSLGVVDLEELLPDTDFSNARVGCGWGASGDDRMWTDNFQVGSRIGATKASRPSPAHRQADVLRDTVLGWTPAESAQAHDVYFGTDANDVNDADRTNPLDVLQAQNQDANSFTPTAILEFGRTYYWRVDEVLGAPYNTVVKGNIWSFTAEPYSIPVEGGIQATASSQSSLATGPEKTVDGSGLNNADQHSTEDGTMWLSAANDPAPWIQYEFDRVYKLDKMQVWNSNGTAEPAAGFGVKDVTIEITADGTTWTQLENVPALAQAPGEDGYEANTVVAFGDAVAKMVKINVESNHSGLTPAYGLSEVRFFCVPTYAREPQPADGEVTDGVDVELSWRAGREAASHEVYFGTDVNDLTLVDIIGENTYIPDGILYGTKYYWSVTEANDAEIPASYAGDIWSFTTAEYSVVDDFESYTNDSPHRVFQTWTDGLGFSADEFFPEDVPGNGTGALVGHDIWDSGSDYYEGEIIEIERAYLGEKSMPFYYDNTAAPYLSETARTFEPPQDWTTNGVQSLCLSFYGDPANTSGTLYVEINDAKIDYDGDPADLTEPAWHAWNIELSTVAADLSQVTQLTIGIEGSGATGLVLIDGICLSPKAPEYAVPTEPDAAGLIVHYEFEGTTDDSSGQRNHGTALDDPEFVAGVEGQGIDLNGWSQTVRIPHSSALKPEQAITISAWVKADDITFNQYSEIYRKEDGSARHLLSFQEFGTILSLGLGIGGRYAELDAAINPADYTDSDWHLVTATYDGSYKRVYSDGGLLGAAAASGPIMTDGTADGYIGSWDNAGEFLDGQIDDFRLYSRALSLEEILWLAGKTTAVHKPF